MNDDIEAHVLRRYEILRQIGQGAYGIVWKAVDKQNKQPVALKKIFSAFQNPTDAKRTYREIMYLRYLDHPNVIKILDVIPSEGDLDIYVIFEYMEADLHAAIRSKILQEIHFRVIALQLLRCVSYLHKMNVIHRDLKPSNILINSNSLIKLADFGLIRSLPPSDQETHCKWAEYDKIGDFENTKNGIVVQNTELTKFQRKQNQESEFNESSIDIDPQILTEYVATRWYRAPEILLGSRQYTRAVDLWSIGCILGEMLLGRPLFPGNSTFNQLELIFAFTGYPKPDEISKIDIEPVKSILKLLHPTVRKQFPEAVLQEHPLAVDLISQLLKIDPQVRLTADEALLHPFVAQLQTLDPESAPVTKRNLEFIEITTSKVEDFRRQLYQELGLDKKSMEPSVKPNESNKEQSISSKSRLSNENPSQIVDLKQRNQSHIPSNETSDLHQNRNVNKTIHPRLVGSQKNISHEQKSQSNSLVSGEGCKKSKSSPAATQQLISTEQNMLIDPERSKPTQASMNKPHPHHMTTPAHLSSHQGLEKVQQFCKPKTLPISCGAKPGSKQVINTNLQIFPRQVQWNRSNMARPMNSAYSKVKNGFEASIARLCSGQSLQQSQFFNNSSKQVIIKVGVKNTFHQGHERLKQQNPDYQVIRSKKNNRPNSRQTGSNNQSYAQDDKNTSIQVENHIANLPARASSSGFGNSQDNLSVNDIVSAPTVNAETPLGSGLRGLKKVLELDESKNDKESNKIEILNGSRKPEGMEIGLSQHEVRDHIQRQQGRFSFHVSAKGSARSRPGQSFHVKEKEQFPAHIQETCKPSESINKVQLAQTLKNPANFHYFTNALQRNQQLIDQIVKTKKIDIAINNGFNELPINQPGANKLVGKQQNNMLKGNQHRPTANNHNTFDVRSFAKQIHSIQGREKALNRISGRLDQTDVNLTHNIQQHLLSNQDNTHGYKYNEITDNIKLQAAAYKERFPVKF